MQATVMELRCLLIKASVIAYCILLCVILAKADVTCTAGKFVAMSQGVVRCDFGTDARKDQHNFNVVRYDNDILQDSRKNLLVCNWNNKTLDCFVKAPGYLFDDRVDSTLTLVIPVVDKSMAGLYRCQLVPKPPDIQMNTCNLTVIETPSPESTRMPSATATLTVNSRSSAESEAAVPATPFIVFSIVFFIVIVVLVLYIIFRRRILWKVRRLQRRFRTRHEHRAGENSPEEAVVVAGIPLMDINRHVKYRDNTSHKPTQVFIETLEKSIQFGNEMGVMSDNKSTQLYREEVMFLTGALKASDGDVLLTGSAKRYRNPTYSTLGTPPVQLPPKYDETDLFSS